MLEIKNVTKIYHTKKGADVTALDDISIRFGETGLVFLLGKSGSGKSTLLNVAGGLDEPTAGEVVVMGKSSKDFSGSDFDSYRNTYVGFVFQEYNVLNEFNVEDNVALALELQGKTRNKEKIAEILREVELDRFAKRKPNTLSGGQKQRIAIARALVKDPQIIMADEPTGALDSATGIQVLDTLKKLSENRLVLIVSHDREFAEIYGDRIIELKDGKIVSDVTKVKTPAEQMGDNVIKIGEDTLSIKNGATLSEANLRAIQKFVSEASGDVIISKGKTEIANFKKANRIDESGSRERFDETREESLVLKTYGKDEAKFIRSSLPARKAVKIGASGLKLKPFRLVFTLLLSLVAFVMFGLFSTMMVYDGDAVRKQSFLNSDYEYLTIRKYYLSHETRTYSDGSDIYDNYYNQAYFTPEEAARFDNSFGTISFQRNITNVETNTNDMYHVKTIYMAGVLPEGNALRNTITGTYPADENEICISSYLFDCLKSGTYYTVDESGEIGSPVTLNSESQIIGSYLKISDGVYKVTGVFDSGEIPSNYESLQSGGSDYSLLYQYQDYLQSSLHGCIMVCEEFVSKLHDSYYYNYFHYGSNILTFNDSEGNTIYSYSSVQIYDAAEKTLPITFINESYNTLTENQIILPLSSLRSIAQTISSQKIMELDQQINEKYAEFEEERSALISDLEKQRDSLYGEYDRLYQLYLDLQNQRSALEYQDETYMKLTEQMKQIDGQMAVIIEKIDSLSEQLTSLYSGEPVNETLQALQDEINRLREEGNGISAATDNAFNILLSQEGLTETEIAEAKDYILSLLRGEDLTVTCEINDIPNGSYEIVGYYTDDMYHGVYCAQSLYDAAEVYDDMQAVTNYKAESDAMYDYLFLYFDRTESSYYNIFSVLGESNINEETDVWYYLDNELELNVNQANSLITGLSMVFLIVGIVMALFAALLLFNFITMSIANKQKEIGILRAVGARGIDVFKIFFSESGIIVGICLVLSIVGTAIVASVLNNVLKAQIGLQVTLFVFGWLSAVIMIAIAVFVAFIATFLPVYFAARKKPVESIRAL